jgi:hypothetical protein
MFEVSSELRKAYLATLSTVTVQGVVIPFYDELMGSKVAKIGFADAYCLITDQTSSDILIKCGFYQDVRISIDIVTKFPKNKGGKLLCEQISNEIQKLIRTGNTTDYPAMDDFKIITCVKTLNRSIIEENIDNTVFRTILTFNHKIQQIT